MKTKFPLRSLLKLSCIFSVAISLFIFISSFMEGENLHGAVSRSVNFLFLITAINISNIGLLLVLKQKDPVKQKKSIIWLYLISFVMSTIVILLFYVINNYLVSKGVVLRSTSLKVKGDIVYFYLALQGTLLNGIVLLFQNFIIVQDSNNKAQLENSRLNTARSEAANQLLLQQIHPHFLFNALNILKSLIKRSPEKAEDYLVRLSDFLRASVSGNKSGVAPLHEEIKLCMDYLEMQKVRFGDALSFSFDLKTEPSSAAQVLPVFSLQPLLENAIKHNELTDATPLSISVKQIGEWITVSNNIQLKSDLEDSTGSGLYNLMERYNLLSGHEIEIKDNGITFSVSLKILNNEDRNHRR